jgi:hypothetical protein
MAKTIDQFSTIEDFRKKYNELAVDVGDTSGLRTTKTATVVDALNSLEDKLFFFQEFIYTATASQTVFTGADTYGTTLLTRKNKIQVYKNGVHLNEATQYTATDPDDKGNFDSITLSSGANAGDNITIYAFTGSFEGLGGSLNLSGQFTETAANAIYNVNSDGVILKGSSLNSTTTLQSGYTIQLAGKTYGEEDLTLAASKTLSAPTITDNILSINSGSITSGVTGTFSSTLTAGSFTDNTLTITGGDITGVDDITGTADSVFTAFKFIDKTGATLTGGVGTGFSAITSTAFTGDLTGDVTGDLTGNADTATTLATARTIAGQSFNGSANITIGGSDLSDINYTTTPAAGQALIWDNGSGYWEPTTLGSTTDSYTEGTNNKYFTDDRVNAIIVDGIGLSKVYVDNPDGGDDTPIDGRSTLSVNTTDGITTKASPANAGAAQTDNVRLDYETVSTAPTAVGTTATGHLWFVI